MNKKLANFISRVLPHYINFIKFRQNELHLDLISYSFLKRVLFFFKYSGFTQFKSLMDIIAIDYLNNYNRFELVYNLLSVKYNSRIFVKIYLNDFLSVNSVSNLFFSSNWSEREIWDMFGIFFYGHKDLRRILNNYGFNGYSLRKDFSLNGYISYRYDDFNKLIWSESLELSQLNLDFNYNNPWK